MAFDKKPVAWITVKGNRIPLFEGETAKDAITRKFGANKNKTHVEESRAPEPNFKSREEAYSYYEKKFSECSSTYRNKVATQLGINARGKEKIKELARIYTERWVKAHPDDEQLKQQQISRNKEEAERVIDQQKPTDSYYKYDTTEEMTEQFMRDTNIMVDGAVPLLAHRRCLATTYDTVKNIRDKYGAFVNNIKIEPEGSVHMEESTIACMSNNGTLTLNAAYFSRPEEFKRMQKNNNTSYFPYHPKTADACEGAVAHEMGHAILFKQMRNWYLDAVQQDPTNAVRHYQEAYSFLDMKWPHVAPGNTLYNKLHSAFDGIGDKISNDPEIIKRWGGKPNLSVIGWANPQYSMPGIGVSEYAGKNFHELVAESFCEVYCNGYDDASRVAKEVWNTIIKGAWVK